MGYNYRTRDGRPTLRYDNARRLSWCSAKFPYWDDCWAASMGRILGKLACRNCDLLKK